MVVDVKTVCAVGVKEDAVLVREVKTIIEQYSYCKGLLQIARAHKTIRVRACN